MKYFLITALLLCYLSAHSQAVDYAPVQFGQFFNTYSLINPASCGFRDKYELLSGRQQHSGAWKKIATTFASGFTRFNENKRGNFQTAALAFVVDKEGQYLKRSRAILTYGWHTPLTSELSIGVGASAGFFSYTVSSSNASVSGSATTADASLGVWLYSRLYYIGFSGNQILNGKLTPLEETTELIRHYNVTGSYTFEVHWSVTITPQFLLRYVEGRPLDIDVAAIGAVNKVVAVGINYRHNKSIVPIVGFQNIHFGKGTGKVMFSYAIPSGKIADNIQTYELTLGYHLRVIPKIKVKEKKKVTSFSK
jgi:type IX secretion system PorP/SprF family membrane protein